MTKRFGLWRPALIAAAALFARPACGQTPLSIVLLPALGRSGERVSVRVVLWSMPCPSCLQAVKYVIDYPPSVAPAPADIALEGLEPYVLINGSVDTSGRRITVVEIAGSIPIPAGTTVDVPFDIASTAVPGLTALTESLLEGMDKGGTCCTGERAIGRLLISIPSKPGDVDGDGQVTVADALWTLRLAIGLATGSPGVLAAAHGSPVTGGKVTLSDVQRVLRMAVGLGSGML